MTTTNPVDWDTIQEEILCPLCGYNLRGLIEPRCPECGSRYQWSDLLDPRRRKHPYLFEHHPERNLGSFWRTLKGGLRPRRFWRSLHPVQPRSLPRLFLYVVAVVFLVAVGHVIAMFQTRFNVKSYSQMYWWGSGVSPDVSDMLRDTLDSLVINPVTDDDYVAMIVFAWPVITFLSLLIFQISMRRAKVEAGHVIRCVVYSCDIFVWLTIATIAYKGIESLILYTTSFEQDLSFFLFLWIILVMINDLAKPTRNRRTRWARWFFMLVRGLVWFGAMFFLNSIIYEGSFTGRLTRLSVIPGILVVTFVLGVHRLILAYRHYLQFDRPIATIAASQVVVLLVMLNVLLFFTLW